MAQNYKIKLSNLDEFAQNFSKNLKQGDIICLRGELGVGKTTLASKIINILSNKKIDVTSPTFNLVSVYSNEKFDIWHFDLYRMQNKYDIFELGIEDAFKYGVSIIEWPDIILDIIPKHAKMIEMNFSKEEEVRDLTIKI